MALPSCIIAYRVCFGVDRGNPRPYSLGRARPFYALRLVPEPGPDGISTPMPKRVLIVDDCINAADQLRSIVEALPGFTVVGHAHNGAEGLKLFAQLSPDVVCMDIVMPMMDGLQTARAILQRNPAALVYMISSIADVPAKLSKAIELGARDIIAKPFDREEIQAMLLA